MLLEPDRSPYDINFRLFGTPVRVHPFFWLMSVVFGWNALQGPDGGFLYLAIWVFCVFVSILLHEFGHVWAGKAFGSDGSIVLYSFGGLAIGASDLRHRWQRIAVSLAGPGIQLALYAALKLAEFRMGPEAWDKMPPALQEMLDDLLLINFLWALFNLLPVWPLDGGKVSREVCTAVSRTYGVKASLRISIAVGAFIAVNALAARYGSAHVPYLPTSIYAALLFGALAFESYQLLMRTPVWRYEPPDDDLPWER
jgi:Zn-dependent protease